MSCLAAISPPLVSFFFYFTFNFWSVGRLVTHHALAMKVILIKFAEKQKLENLIEFQKCKNGQNLRVTDKTTDDRRRYHLPRCVCVCVVCSECELVHLKCDLSCDKNRREGKKNDLRAEIRSL